MGRVVTDPVVVTVVAFTTVKVEDTPRVVSDSAVPVIVMTVVPAADVATVVPPLTTVVLNTVTAVRVAVVATGIVVTVWFVTIVSKVERGSVTVCAIES